MEILVELLKVDTIDPLCGYKFPRSITLGAIDVVEKRIERNGGIIGEELPPIEERCEYIDPSRASHVVKHIWIDGDTVMAKLKLVGKYRELSEAGIEFDGYLRFVHCVGEDNVTATVMTIITVDLRYAEK